MVNERNPNNNQEQQSSKATENANNKEKHLNPFSDKIYSPKNKEVAEEEIKEEQQWKEANTERD
jgi:hypothetical protein